VLIGARLRQLRDQKGLSQGDIEHATGLLRCYISRVENGHTIPSIETLERFATALDVPLYQLFWDNGASPPVPHLAPLTTSEALAEENSEAGEDARFLLKLKGWVGKLSDPDRNLLLDLAKKLSSR
jgi:transcriptional regulator with XRE-family HTH domain